jgi:hypothetical protein
MAEQAGEFVAQSLQYLDCWRAARIWSDSYSVMRFASRVLARGAWCVVLRARYCALDASLGLTETRSDFVAEIRNLLLVALF